MSTMRSSSGNGSFSDIHSCPFEHVRQLCSVVDPQVQPNISPDAPARLKQELDTILTLQAEIESINKTIQSTKTTFAKTIPDASRIVHDLEMVHNNLTTKVEDLYASLNIQESFDDLDGIDLSFVHTMLLARDLKINIRKRAIGSFFEWDKLNRAVGGRQQALGTKLHQQTRKAITKRTPALMTAIRRFNRYCETLKGLYKPEWNLPLPEPLPTELIALREAPHLMEDVWTTRSETAIPRWLEDVNVRRGIRAMLKRDRCQEELKRLEREAHNLSEFFGSELLAIERAMMSPDSEYRILKSSMACVHAADPLLA
jgi:hypothetical protein